MLKTIVCNFKKIQPCIIKRFYSENNNKFEKKIFSGVQPTGTLHIGNYLGAVKNWVDLQNAGENVTYCIVDLHSITIPQDPAALKQNILQMTATLLACGINPDKATLFLQSTVKEHSELCWILGCITTMARLGHLPQYKEKSTKFKEIPLGLFVYPVLQAADILLYKATHVPVGEDQVQHLQLAQQLAKTFNHKFGPTFPIIKAMIADDLSCRIRSLRDPTKKMSKSDPDSRSTIFLTDTPDQIFEKIKKSVTDCISEVTYEPETRFGVANLITLHSLVADFTPEEICCEAEGIDTGKYKYKVSDAVIEFLNPIRLQIEDYLKNPDYLVNVLNVGSLKATEIANNTMQEIKDKVGLGINVNNLLIKQKQNI